MLYDMLSASVAKHPEKVAIEIADARITYALLQKYVDQFVADLHDLALTSGDRVVLFLPNGLEFVVAVFAVAKLRGIIVPLNTALESEDLRFYLTDSRPRVLVSTDGLVSRHAQLIQDNTHHCQIITRVPMYASGSCNVEIAAQTDSSATVLYQYSSGTTGKPKRVARTQANLVHEANNYKLTVGVTAADCILCVVPMFHAHGFGNCLLAAVYAGATMVILPSFRRESVMEVLENRQVTIFPGVPFMFSILADSTSIAHVRLTHLRLAFTAGAPLPHKIFQRFNEKFGVAVRQLYGSTETGAIAINLGNTNGNLWASVGQPLHGVEIRIVDESGYSVQTGEVGEIIIRSNAMSSGYDGHDGLTRETFRNGYYWSGDLGKLDSNGHLFIIGRKKLFINVGANKVDPDEVEAVLNTHPAIRESVVLGIPGPYGDEIIKAVLVLNHKMSVEEVKSWCHTRIADFKLPRIVEFRQEIPRSPLGKILRKLLQDNAPLSGD